ncbi:hypothetical protein BVY02_01420 [bacterium J17]|nr:hypothetical protein BVY02_01420 [bacterium J17]
MIYLDSNSSAKLRLSAQEAIEDYLRCEKSLGNASSVHAHGRNSRKIIRQARRSLAELIRFGDTNHSEPEFDIVFTSGGTESCNLLVHGFIGRERRKHPGHIICSAIEHHAMLESVRDLENCGWDVSYLRPESDGRLSPATIFSALRQNTALVSCMSANNETGALQEVAIIAKGLRESGYQGPIVSDFTQSMGKSRSSPAHFFEAGGNGCRGICT